MKEPRRHQRIRFISPPAIRVGRFGWGGLGELENLSPGVLMLRCAAPLGVGETIGCEFTLFDSTCIDLSALVVSPLCQDRCRLIFEDKAGGDDRGEMKRVSYAPERRQWAIAQM